MHKTLTLCIVSLALAASALPVAAQSRAKGKIAEAVAGKLVKAEKKKVVPYSIDAAPKYYVLYHSAGW